MKLIKRIKKIALRPYKMIEKVGFKRTALMMLACAILGGIPISFIFTMMGIYSPPYFLYIFFHILYAFLFFYKFAYEVVMKRK